MRLHKIPVSVLVVIYTEDWQVLLMERADHPGYWQSVTGSMNENESLMDTARREVGEETGIEDGVLSDWKIENRYEIYPHWRHRYAPGVRENTEHVFGLKVKKPCPVKLSPREHLNYVWLPFEDAAQKVFSPSNREAILKLPEMNGE